MDVPQPYPGQELNLGKLNLTLGWLRQYDESLDAWQSLLQTANVTLESLRVRGYHREAAAELRDALHPVATSERAQRVADDLVKFVQEQSEQARPGERLPASTEVLESLIGKGKRLEGQQSQGGFTKSVLAMAATLAEGLTDSVAAGLSLDAVFFLAVSAAPRLRLNKTRVIMLISVFMTCMCLLAEGREEYMA